MDFVIAKIDFDIVMIQTYLYLNLGTKRIKTKVSLNVGHHGIDVVGTGSSITIETCNPGVFITNL